MFVAEEKKEKKEEEKEEEKDEKEEKEGVGSFVFSSKCSALTFC